MRVTGAMNVIPIVWGAQTSRALARPHEVRGGIDRIEDRLEKGVTLNEETMSKARRHDMERAATDRSFRQLTLREMGGTRMRRGKAL